MKYVPTHREVAMTIVDQAGGDPQLLVGAISVALLMERKAAVMETLEWCGLSQGEIARREKQRRVEWYRAARTKSDVKRAANCPPVKRIPTFMTQDGIEAYSVTKYDGLNRWEQHVSLPYVSFLESRQ